MMKNLIANKESKQILLTFLKNKKDAILPIFIVFCLPVLLYLQTLSFGFVYFDDIEIITNNIAFLSDLRNAPQAFLKDAFLAKSGHFYRPLQTLSYMADISLSGGNNTWMYHLTNLLLLGLIACLLFLLFRKFLIPLKLALLSTLVYCAHPLFISSIAWIPARGDLLLLLFSLLSFLFFIEHLQKRKVIYLFLHWLTFIIALFCKETAVILPFLFIIYYFTFSFETPMLKRTIFKGTSIKGHEDILQEQGNCMGVRRRDLWAVLRERSATKKHATYSLLTLVLYTMSGIFWFWLRSIAIGKFPIRNILTTLISNLQTIPESLASFFLPFDIDLIPSFSLSKTLTGLGIIIMIIVIFFNNKERTKKEKVFCFSLFLFLLFPTMLYKNEYYDYLNHRFFLPLIGILLFVLFSFPKKWFEKKDIKSSWLMVVIFVFLSSLTFIKSRSYSDPMTFYNSAITQNPNNAMNYNNRGSIKDNNISDFQGAINDFTKAIVLNPVYAYAYNNRGITYYKIGDFENAIKDFNKAIELDPNYADAYDNRGNVNKAIGDLKSAINDYDNAINLKPDLAEAYYNRGIAYSTKNDLDNAIKDFIKTIKLNPNYAEAYNNLGLAYQAIGDFESAIKDYDKAIELKPSFADAFYNRGNAYSAKDDLDNAIKDYDKAIELNPNYAEAYNNLGLAYQAIGDLESAIKDCDKAIELKPSLAEAYYSRGNSYLFKGNFESAVKDYDKAIKLKPGYAEAYGNRGIAYSKKGDLITAIKDYNKAIELNPGDANAYGNLGNAYKAKGMLKEAGQGFKMYEKLKKK